MGKIKICFSYQYKTGPAGGGNNFIRALYQNLSQDENFELVDDLSGDYRILFMNQTSRGPGSSTQWHLFSARDKAYPLKEIADLLGNGKCRKKLVVRAINLLQHSRGASIWNSLLYHHRDAPIIQLLHRADHVVFQSEYQKGFFLKYGYQSREDSVIQNGADPIFQGASRRRLDPAGPVRLVSSGSPRGSKRHDLIAKFSKLEKVEVSYLGDWPEGTRTEKVRLLGPLSHAEIKIILEKSHAFLFPSEREVCSNAVCEALCSGLPVLYHPDCASSRELIQNNGLPLNLSDMRESLEKLIQQYDEMTDRIEKTKSNYSINRAAEKYKALFRSLAGAP